MLYLGADHQGYNTKEKIKKYLDKLGVNYKDCGAKQKKQYDDYPDLAQKVCHHINSKKDKGILICSTGIGMSISANRFKHIRAGLCYNKKTAKHSREQNNINVLCLSKKANFKPIIKTFLKTKFSYKKRHKRRLNKINHA